MPIINFSVERWSFQSDQLEYVETVTLELNENVRLVPLSPYLEKFLNSTTIGLPESYGKKFLKTQDNVISTKTGV